MRRRLLEFIQYTVKVYINCKAEADDLSSLAFLDARHDFKPGICAHYFSILQESLPGAISWISSEDAALRMASDCRPLH